MTREAPPATTSATFGAQRAAQPPEQVAQLQPVAARAGAAPARPAITWRVIASISWARSSGGAVIGGSSALGVRYCCSICGDLGDALAVPFRAPRGGEERVGDLEGQALADHPGAEGQHVGVVVLAGVAGHRGVVGVGGADARDLVGGHRGADAGAVDDDPGRAGAGRDQAGDDVGEVRVVHGVRAVGAAVGDGEALLAQVLDEDGLEGEAAVVRADGDGLPVGLDGAGRRRRGAAGGGAAPRRAGRRRAPDLDGLERALHQLADHDLVGEAPLSHGPAPTRRWRRRRRAR